MRLHYLERSSERDKTNQIAGAAGIVGGLALMGAAAIGILSNEARTPEEAIGSINVAGNTYFVEGEELPLIGLGVIGLIAVGTGVELIRKQDEE